MLTMVSSVHVPTEVYPTKFNPCNKKIAGVPDALLDLFVLFHFSVADVDDAVGVDCDIVLVSH
jgi:hypothetical protein